MSATSQVPPPTNGEVVDETTTTTTTTTVTTTTTTTTPTIRIQPTPGPAGNGRFFFDAPDAPSIVLVFRPLPIFTKSIKADRRSSWLGQMDIKCSDVPLMMREGLHWSTANIVKEEGYVEDIDPRKADRLGQHYFQCTVTRYWFLRDLQEPPRWTTCLRIHAPDHDSAPKIRFDDWTLKMVHMARAWGLSKKLIYQYDIRKPQDCFNCIYDNMPLKGWWPCPKERE
ncbi:uncharacterized protein F4822DRAFT_393929 [Hypoxylon trugodes]|uniref:uncharacterized protein n=1 Tax=Hypoxylon trugodes TaxID=326681 RepID=UPI002195EDFF|nr:uncharacterized protein F4822DRAFT_393929 [Hypoxylon trugodes]KAI1390656.1 hypothetical protein F4822DRAFT_393929 [Hypoxylon trugodes]